MSTLFQSWQQTGTANPRRVEFHIVPLEDCWYLFCLSGRVAVERVCSQGPLASAEVAEGCCGQIVRVLVRHGYRIAGDQQWQLPAWRERKARLLERRSHSVDCTFREDQVWPWPGK